jgi:KaiC/GvpD/RAD55 family RecA-like ATPase
MSSHDDLVGMEVEMAERISFWQTAHEVKGLVSHVRRQAVGGADGRLKRSTKGRQTRSALRMHLRMKLGQSPR